MSNKFDEVKFDTEQTVYEQSQFNTGFFLPAVYPTPDLPLTVNTKGYISQSTITLNPTLPYHKVFFQVGTGSFIYGELHFFLNNSKLLSLPWFEGGTLIGLLSIPMTNAFGNDTLVGELNTNLIPATRVLLKADEMRVYVQHLSLNGNVNFRTAIQSSSHPW